MVLPTKTQPDGKKNNEKQIMPHAVFFLFLRELTKKSKQNTRLFLKKEKLVFLTTYSTHVALQ